MRLKKKKTLLDQAADYVESVRPQVETAVANAREAVEEFYETTARPALADAREKAGPALADAREKAAPVVATGAAKASKVAAQAKEAADARLAQLKGEPPKKKGGKLKKIALFAAIAGAVGFIAKKLQGGGQSDNWQSSYVPSPAPAPTPAPAKPAKPTDDVGGAGPDEALADATEEPHAVTTPDQPADVVDLDTADEASPTDR